MIPPHDIYQAHLMKFAGILHEMSSRNLRDGTNLFAVQQTVKQINETLDLLTAPGHTSADLNAAETLGWPSHLQLKMGPA